MIYFSHIPKTAGTTLRSFISQFFPEDRIFSAQLWNELENPEMTDWSKYDFVSGHFGHALTTYLPDNTKTITMLRDPIQRTVSQYNHVVSDRYFEHKIGKRRIKDIGNGDMNLMLQDAECADYFSNIQLKFIALSCKPVERGMVSFGNWEETIINNSKAQLLDLALNRVSKYYFLGIQEFFEQSYLLLSYKEGFHPYFDGERRMVMEKKLQFNSIKDELLEKLYEINDLDLKLYSYSVEIFKKDYNNMCEKICSSLGVSIPDFSDTASIKDLLVKYQKINKNIQ
ncbi:MAG: sulfotransferase family 2 domain-containing protein [Patescibacteria group bacterium]